MAGSFSRVLFRDVDLSDSFFDSLRGDYPEFNDWFARKADAGETALVYTDDEGIGVFVYLKDECEALELVGQTLPSLPRIKVGTLKVSDRVQGERLGEGAIGLALWHWRDSGCTQVYVTVYEKHESLVRLLSKFGFRRAGSKSNGETVYLKDRQVLDYADPYKAFPFLNPAFDSANLLPIDDVFHDQLFPYSELAREIHDTFTSAAGNGVSKVYISAARDLAARPGHPILIYRKHTGGQGAPGFKSVVTSYCVVTEVVTVKRDGRALLTFKDFRQRVRNKSVFTDEQIRVWFEGGKNLTLIEMVYLGYFGAGHNVNWMWLKNNGYWREGSYPHQFMYTREEFRRVLEAGDVDIATAIIN
jgi:GNAT superfamily N-acetyltransferase